MKISLALMLLTLTMMGCTHMEKVVTVAEKSYELGCVENGKGSATENLRCHMAAERFKKQLKQTWVEMNR